MIQPCLRSQPISLVTASNDERLLRSCLLASPELAVNCEVSIQSGAVSAAQAYNRGISETQAEIVCFAHQDVYFPSGWMKCLAGSVNWLMQQDPAWGVLGVYGVTADGECRGWAYSTGLGRLLGAPFLQPQPVRTLDEMVLVIRRSSGLRFDEALPGFHLYGTDICLEAERMGLRNYVVPALALHNSNGIAVLPWAFWRAWLFVRRKWFNLLPIDTPCVKIEKLPAAAVKTALAQVYSTVIRRKQPGKRVADPEILWRRLFERYETSIGLRG